MRVDVHFYHRLAYLVVDDLSGLEVNFHVGRGGPGISGIPNLELVHRPSRFGCISTAPEMTIENRIDVAPLLAEAEGEETNSHDENEAIYNLGSNVRYITYLNKAKQLASLSATIAATASSAAIFDADMKDLDDIFAEVWDGVARRHAIMDAEQPGDITDGFRPQHCMLNGRSSVLSAGKKKRSHSVVVDFNIDAVEAEASPRQQPQPPNPVVEIDPMEAESPRQPQQKESLTDRSRREHKRPARFREE
jgi:hypothetical protein